MNKFRLDSSKIFLISLFTFLTIIFTICIFFVIVVFAKYISLVDFDSSVNIGKVGTLKLTETKSSDDTDDNQDSIELNSNSIVKKSLSVSYDSKDVASYIYFVVNASGWEYTDGTNKLSIKGSYNVDMAYFIVNNNWKYLKSETQKDESVNFIFYQEVPINTSFIDSNIISNIYINAVSVNDIKKNNLLTLNDDHAISFSAYVIQKQGVDNAFIGWDYVSKVS